MHLVSFTHKNKTLVTINASRSFSLKFPWEKKYIVEQGLSQFTTGMGSQILRMCSPFMRANGESRLIRTRIGLAKLNPWTVNNPRRQMTADTVLPGHVNIGKTTLTSNVYERGRNSDTILWRVKVYKY